MSQKRLDAVRRELGVHRIQAFLVTELSHIRYLTGFTGSNALCFITPRRAFLLTDSRYQTQAPKEVRGAKVLIVRGSLYSALSDSGLLKSGMRVGTDEEHLTAVALRRLRRESPRSSFAPLPPIVERLSAIKDAGEIRLIKRAAEISDAVFRKVLDVIRPGVRECEVAAEISYWHRTLGAETDAFDPIVASGPRGALPHARATEKKIKRGEMVVVDFGCRVGGYNSDITRTVAIGKPTAIMKRVYDVVREAQLRAIDAVHDGIEARALDAVARAIIIDAGYGPQFVHSLGHGLGIHIHDSLRLSTLSTDLLHTNNVVTIEPGIYLPGKGGVRIEDDVVVTATGCTILTQSPRDLISI